MDPNYQPDVLAEYARVTSPIPAATDTSLFGGVGPTQPDLNVGPAPPVASVPAAPQAQTPAVPPAAAPSSAAPSTNVNGQPQQSKEGKSWQDYSLNLMSNPETAAMVIAIGAALGSTRFRTPQERLSGAFITGMSALGATYASQQKRLEAEGKIANEGARTKAVLQEADAATSNAQTNAARVKQEADIAAGRNAIESQRLDVEREGQNSRAAIAKAELAQKRDELAAHTKLYAAQIADLADQKVGRTAKMILDSGNKAIDEIYKAAAANGDNVNPADVQKQADAVMTQMSQRLQQIGVNVPGIQNPALERVKGRLRALNPTATDEQIDAAAKAAITQAQQPPAVGPNGMQAGPH